MPLRPSSPWPLLALLCASACQRGDRVDGTAIILVMDGVRLEETLGDELSSATGEHPQELMPSTWSQLLPQAVRASQAWNLGVTSTTPAHAALISGRRQSLATFSASDELDLYRPQLPSFFEAVRDQLEASEDQVVLVANTGLVRPVERSLWPGAEGAKWVWVGDEDGSPALDDRLVLGRLEEQLDEVPTRLALVNMHQLDRSGHYGSSRAYLDDLGTIDDPIAELWAWLQGHRDYRGDTTLVVIADHGRHSSSDDDPVWRHHGDECNGCRRVPALLLGPDLAQGVDLDEPLLLTDVAPTLAAVLGVELPWADGLALEGVFAESVRLSSRSGLADVAVAGELVAELRYQVDPSHRSALWVEGTQLSGSEALLVEAPALAHAGELAWVCFRSLVLAPDQSSTPWLARCAHSQDGGSSWASMPTPVEQVGPGWRPVLVPSGEAELLAIWIDNPAGTTEGGAVGAEGELGLVVSRYDGAWTSARLDPGLSYPTDIAATLSGGHLVVAVGAGPEGKGGQHARDIWVGSASLAETEPSWSRMTATRLGELLGVEGAWRLELPALRVDEDGTLHLAAVAQSDAGSHGVLGSSDDLGRSWNAAALVDMPHPVDPHQAPVWWQGRAVWVAVDVTEDESWLCAASLDREPSCQRSGSPRISRLLAAEELSAVVDIGVGAWELESFEI